MKFQIFCMVLKIPLWLLLVTSLASLKFLKIHCWSYLFNDPNGFLYGLLISDIRIPKFCMF